MRRPNIVLITLDQFRADHLGCGGHPHARTPTLDRLAAEGVRFANHFSNCAPCAPGRASLLTGLWQMNHRVTSNGAPLADDLPMLPRLLRDVGYRPTLFGYTDTALDPRTMSADDPNRGHWEAPMDGFELGVLLDESIGPWLDWLEEHGIERPQRPDDIYLPADVEVPPDRGETWAPTRYPAELTESAFITATALDWLNEPGRSDEPWCAHLSYLRPHPPYIVPEPYNDMFDPADMEPPVRHPSVEEEAALHPFVAGALGIVPSPASELDQQQLRATYLGMIAEVDHQLGVFLDGLERSGMAQDTIVIVTSDHGEQLGDHWFVEKLGFFDQSYAIPLIIRWPAMSARPGTVVEAFTENVDIVPTLLDLIDAPPSPFCDGASLRPFLSPPDDGPDPRAPDGWRTGAHFEYDFRDPTSTLMEDVFGLRQDECVVSVLRTHDAKYVHFAGSLPSLYFDLRADPGELRDASADPGADAAQLALTQQLLSLRMSHTDPRLANVRVASDGDIHRADPPR